MRITSGPRGRRVSASAAINARHIMRNAWLPVVTILGLQVGGLLAGAVITETVFAWGGVGTYVVEGSATAITSSSRARS